MSETIPKLTLPTLKALSADPEFVRPAAALIVAQTIAQSTKERVDKYIRVVFDMFEFHVTDRFEKLRKEHERETPPDSPFAPGRIITNPDDLFLCEEEDKLKEYYALCDVAHRTAGYNLEEGHCPALIAKYAETEAENALLEHTDSKLGTPFRETYLEKRETALRLILGMALQNPATKRTAKANLPKTQLEAAAYIDQHDKKP